jgi:sialidase-1
VKIALVAVLLAGVLAPGSAQARPTAPFLEQQVLFKAAQEQGYACFRIPTIVRTTRGSLLAFAEGRVNTAGTPATSTWC